MRVGVDTLFASRVFRPCTKDKLAMLIAILTANKRRGPPWLIVMGFTFIITSLCEKPRVRPKSGAFCF